MPKKIMSKTWKRELEKIEPEFKAVQKPYSQVVLKLAAIEVLNHNRKDLERMLENEGHQNERQASHVKKRENALE